MRFQIEHHTEYTYSDKVFLEPHYLQLYPQPRPYFKVERHDLTIDPIPTGKSERLDVENNLIGQCWFTEPVSALKVQSLLEVDSTSFNPYNFLIDNDITSNAPAPFLRVPVESASEFDTWIADIHGSAGADTLKFVTNLNEQIHDNWVHEIREEPSILTPGVCFAAKSGSCRDLSWMMMVGLRKSNIPSRFVSGYAFNPELGEGHELHAWVEAWLPGAGWVGLDPSSGLLADETYIPIHTSADPKNTLPVIGNYRGYANSSLSSKVLIRLL